MELFEGRKDFSNLDPADKQKPFDQPEVEEEIKRRKKSEGNGNGVVDIIGDTKAGTSALNHFEAFELKGILNNSIEQKRVAVEGTYQGQRALVILDKKPFSVEILEKNFFTQQSKLNIVFQNDIYGSYNCSPIEQAAEISATIIIPATQKHIDKWISQTLHVVEETQEIYENVVAPYIEESKFCLDWVYNILEHKKESDRIIYEDLDPTVGFILAPDLKWKGESLEDLHVTAIVNTRGVKSLRDLTHKHLPLLENILVNGTEAVVKKFGIKKSLLRVYLHYHPSYYHLHVHFNAIQNQSGGIFTEKAHLLTSVIGNIKLHNLYYEEGTIPFVVKENDNLFKRLNEYGYKF